MRRHLWLTVLFVSAWAVSQVIPQAEGTWFYAVQSLWSLGLIFAFSMIDRSRVVSWLCILEYLHIINHFMACFAYLTDLDGYLSVYPIILVAINVIEFTLLDLGAPWNGILKRFFLLGRSFSNRSSASHRDLQDPIHIGAKKA